MLVRLAPNGAISTADYASPMLLPHWIDDTLFDHCLQINVWSSICKATGGIACNYWASIRSRIAGVYHISKWTYTLKKVKTLQPLAMASRPQRVAIIGAGISGIVAAAHLKKEGIDVTVFERSNAAGGVWLVYHKKT